MNATTLGHAAASSTELDDDLRRRAAQLRRVLDETDFGAVGKPKPRHAIDAAQALLDLGFPYAFELSPDELFTLRTRQRVRGPLLSAFALLGVPCVAACGVINTFVVLFQLDGSRHLCAALGLGIALTSAMVALAAGYDLYRLSNPAADAVKGAQRLLVWSVIGVAMLALDVCVAEVFNRSCGALHGWANAGWIVPFTLPVALRIRRHLG